MGKQRAWWLLGWVSGLNTKGAFSSAEDAPSLIPQMLHPAGQTGLVHLAMMALVLDTGGWQQQSELAPRSRAGAQGGIQGLWEWSRAWGWESNTSTVLRGRT